MSTPEGYSPEGRSIKRGTKKAIEERRNKVRGFLQKSVRSPTAIASQLNNEWEPWIIKNDIKVILKSAWVWVDEQAMMGFVGDVKLAVEELQNIEVHLQDIIQTKKTADSTKLRALQTKINCIEARLNLQGKGPILMRLKSAKALIAKHEVK